MFKPWFLAILTTVALLSVSLFISLFGVRNRLDTQVFGGRFLEIRDWAETTFMPKHDFLNIIILTLKNPSLENEGTFKFQVTDGNGEILREIEFSGRNVGDPSDARMQFEPLPRSAGKKLILRIERVSADEPLVSIAAGEKGEIAFSAYYRTINKRQAAQDTLSYWRKGVSNNLSFFGLWAILLFGIVLWGRRVR